MPSPELANTLPLGYVPMSTNTAVADTETPGSILNVPGLNVTDGMIVYYPSFKDGKSITPELTGDGLATGHLTINGNGQVYFTVYYYDPINDGWYESDFYFIGRVVDFTLPPVLNAEPGDDIVFEAAVESTLGTIITVSGGAETTNDDGVTWSTTNKEYVPGDTKVRKTLTVGSEFDSRYSDTITVNGISETITAYTRAAYRPSFSEDVEIDILENSTHVGVFAVAIGEGSIVYSLSGPDADLFTITADTAILSFKDRPDYERPGSSSNSNLYSLIIIATNSEASDQMSLTINVTDVLEYSDSPTFSIPPVTDAEPNTYQYAQGPLSGVQDGTMLVSTSAELSNNNGDTWTTDPLPFVSGSTLFRVARKSSQTPGVSVTYHVQINNTIVDFSITTARVTERIKLLSEYYFEVPENQVEIGQIVPESGTVDRWIIDDERFVIDDQGNLRISNVKYFNYERIEIIFKFEIKAIDRFRRSSKSRVRVKITDVAEPNDGMPNPSFSFKR